MTVLKKWRLETIEKIKDALGFPPDSVHQWGQGMVAEARRRNESLDEPIPDLDKEPLGPGHGKKM